MCYNDLAMMSHKIHPNYLQPIVRHFAPPDGDEDLCVVGEVR